MFACINAKTKSGADNVVGYRGFEGKPSIGNFVQVDKVWWEIIDITEHNNGNYLNITVK